MLLVLAIIWGIAGWYWLAGRSEGRPADSIGSFRHTLHVLDRTTPAVVAPANSLSARRKAAAPAPPAAAHRPARTYTPDSVRRARTLRRRRDVLFALLAGMGATFLLAVLGLGALWALHLLLDAAFAGYVVLLVRMRNAAAERDMKLRFLPGPVQAEPALLLRRSAN